jgi:hypothetical protein
LRAVVRTKAIQIGLQYIYAHAFGAVAISELACVLGDVDPSDCGGEQTAQTASLIITAKNACSAASN